jgi:hypothetical protein
MNMIILCYLNLLDPEIEKTEIKGYLINPNKQKSQCKPFILVVR